MGRNGNGRRMDGFRTNGAIMILWVVAALDNPSASGGQRRLLSSKSLVNLAKAGDTRPRIKSAFAKLPKQFARPDAEILCHPSAVSKTAHGKPMMSRDPSMSRAAVAQAGSGSAASYSALRFGPAWDSGSTH
jgi:hypothetical protein